MFVRIDKDLSVNIQNILSYKLSEDHDSYKLQIWSPNGNIVHNIIYLKDRPEQMQILIDFNNVMRDLTLNIEIIKTANEFIRKNEVEEPRRIQEHLDLGELNE